MDYHRTAPLINSGFHGNITLEIYHHGDNEIFLEPEKTEICQLIFFTLTEPIDEKSPIKNNPLFIQQS
jgi:deoxycytidine triphosphate deaminase